MKIGKIQHTVLVVEDELLIRICSVATLENAGYRVLEADNSAEALAILARPNVVAIFMTDVRMPGEMNGLGLVARVRVDRPDIRSVVVSANVTSEEACNAGAVGMIMKLFTAETLGLLSAIRSTATWSLRQLERRRECVFGCRL
jgi:CheY-like chemotaxis protein